MTNRLTRWLAPSGEAEPQVGDYFIVRTAQSGFYVSPEVAAYVEAVLDRRWTPAWLVFHDMSGSRIRVRTCDVRGVIEYTAEQRASDRRFERAREREDEADEDTPPWERQC